MDTDQEKQQPVATEPTPEPEPKSESVAEAGQQEQGGNGSDGNNDERRSLSLSRETTKDAPTKSVLKNTTLFGAVFFSVFLMAMTGSIISTVS